ncbi:MAG: hypothetical protein ACK451_06720, partial [Pseudanabaena sp.]
FTPQGDGNCRSRKKAKVESQKLIAAQRNKPKSILNSLFFSDKGDENIYARLARLIAQIQTIPMTKGETEPTREHSI